MIQIGDQNKLVACLKQTGVMLLKVIEKLLGSQQDRQQLNFLLSVVLQFTDQLNLRILEFYTENPEMNPILDLNHNSLGVIFRLFEAQPYLRQLWDTSPLF